MASAADCNAGSKIQEAITVNVPDFDTAPMRHHEWVLARIRGRHYLGIARQDCPRFGSWQLGSDGGIAIGTLVHRLLSLLLPVGFFLIDAHRRHGRLPFAYAGREGRATPPPSARRQRQLYRQQPRASLWPRGSCPH